MLLFYLHLSSLTGVEGVQVEKWMVVDTRIGDGRKDNNTWLKETRIDTSSGCENMT